MTSIRQRLHLEKIIELRRARGYWCSKETAKKISLANSHPNTKKKKLSKEHKLKMSLAKLGKKRPNFSGDKNPLWKGGITPIHLQIRTSSEYKAWRKSVLERDNYTCVWCGLKSEQGKFNLMHADHIKPFAYFPELRLILDNGRTLCKPCHLTTDTWGRKYKQKI